MTIDQVEALLKSYAERGVFRGFSRSGSKFKMRWHRDRDFELAVNLRAKTLSMPIVLPEVPAKSAMDRELRQFIRDRQSAERLEHRRIDPAKVEIRCTNRAGNIGLTVLALDGDMKYSIQKLIALVQEIYMEFLYDGRYYDYMVEVFDLDPDHP